MANSAAILRYPQTAHAWVRPGIMLYGGSPFADQDAASLDLKPVMTLRSRILAVQEIGIGERVGYGGTFVAPTADAGRRRRLRLCRRLPAACAGRHADRRRRPAHADPWAGVDGHAGLRPDRPAGGRGRQSGRPLGRGLAGRRGGQRRRGPSATSCSVRWRGACRWSKSEHGAGPGSQKTVFSCTECGASAPSGRDSAPAAGSGTRSSRRLPKRRGRQPAALCRAWRQCRTADAFRDRSARGGPPADRHRRVRSGAGRRAGQPAASC
jgi:hypothetical protein